MKRGHNHAIFKVDSSVVLERIESMQKSVHSRLKKWREIGINTGKINSWHALYNLWHATFLEYQDFGDSRPLKTETEAELREVFECTDGAEVVPNQIAVPPSVEHGAVHVLTPANEKHLGNHDPPCMEVGNLCKEILKRNEKHAGGD
ncbi:hypothetical protein BWQ96_02832 [Gracilariopsis chorda]|uniref:Uncharacterized protein n=1 Tax=Gracilariopsis chorda TaxID=448386 RepID=A0A2V3IYW9_9FLOR|nr:hypothetical protein BWQ96_02832 [Gracilariopsis chorda]|eukprot:PXF47352.1 hypothetical protein BWQ96_02832 [Gracilariopsis chorda]